MDEAAGEEVFYGFFVRHLEVVDVFLWNQEQKTGDRMGSRRGEYRDERGVCFLLDLIGDFSCLEADRERRAVRKREYNGLLERFLPFGREERFYTIAADFVHGLNEGDAGENMVRSREKIFYQEPTGDHSEEEDEDAQENQGEDAGDEQCEAVRWSKSCFLREEFEQFSNDIDEWRREKVEKEKDHHQGEGDWHQDDEAGNEVFLHWCSILGWMTAQEMIYLRAASLFISRKMRSAFLHMTM